MSNYQLISPDKFSKQQQMFIEQFKKSVSIISEQSGIIFGAKDIHSRHLISTNDYAKLVGLRFGKEVTGKLDKEMPCEGTAQYADLFVKEDFNLINSLNPQNSITVLNVHNYSYGLGAMIFKKNILHHHESQAILGTVYSGFKIELKNVLNIIPNYIIKFGITGSIATIDKHHKLNNVHLTDYEQEICFLLLLGWNCGQVATFMNQLKPQSKRRTTDTIIKKKNYICEKFNLPTYDISTLQEFLLEIGFQNSMPKSFYNQIIGSQVL